DTIIIKSKGTVKQIITPDTGILVDFKTLSIPEPPVIKIDGRDSLISALTIMRNDNIKALTKSFDAKRVVDSVKGLYLLLSGTLHCTSKSTVELQLFLLMMRKL